MTIARNQRTTDDEVQEIYFVENDTGRILGNVTRSWEGRGRSHVELKARPNGRLSRSESDVAFEILESMELGEFASMEQGENALVRALEREGFDMALFHGGHGSD